MKTYSTLFVSLLLVVSCTGNSVNSIPTIKFGGMKGDVASAKESKFDAVEKFGELIPDDLDEVIITEYDKDGHQVKYAIYDDDGDLIFKIEDFYENGEIVREKTHQRYADEKNEGIIVERKKNYIKWEFTSGETKSISEVYYDGLYYFVQNDEGEKVAEVYFDKNGRVIDQKNYSGGKIVYRNQQEYDKDGNLSKTTSYDSDGDPTVITYTYPEFDKKGNWITQYVYEDGEVESIVKREITYR